MMRTAMDNNPRTLAAGLGLLLVVALGLALFGRSTASTPESTPADTSIPADTAQPAEDPSTTSTNPTTTRAPTTTVDPVFGLLDDLTAGLSPAEVAGQLVVAGTNGMQTADRLDGTIGTACLGGVFVTESNNNWVPTDDPSAASAMIDTVRQTAASEGCTSGPLVMTDAEFGEIIRVPVESPGPPSGYADRADGSETYNAIADVRDDGVVFATALQDLGIDVNLGAVADVPTDPSHFMARSGRTFGATPGTVAALANALVESHCDVGIAAALKHFPNQGATIEDPHAEPSVAVGGVELWRETGRLPYIDTRAPIVMTGHIFMDLDPELPASMSLSITTGLLRDELGFDGVVITDDLSIMRGAIDVIDDAGSRAVAAIRAGADLALFVRDSDIPSVLTALETEIASNPDFEAQARASVRRVVALKTVLGLVPGIDPGTLSLCS